MHNSIQRVLIDTDIGDDVDDAFALALAAVLPQFCLCGVTTVKALCAYCQVATVASLASAVLAVPEAVTALQAMVGGDRQRTIENLRRAASI